MQKIIKEFPILDQYIYANTAACGIMHDSLLDWRQEHDLDYLIGGSNFKIKSEKIISETRRAVGGFFNCKNENVALVQNFSIGMNMLLEGLDKNNKVLLIEEDYPSLNWPFETRGFPIKKIKLCKDLEDVILQSVKNDAISVLALSIVQYISGLKINLNFLKKLKVEFPGLLIIADGTQFCGSELFSFDDSGIDVLGASAYKWLLAGSGNGFFLFKDEIKTRFSLKTIGFNVAPALSEEIDPVFFVKHFEPGHLDSLSFGSLKCSLEFLNRIGIERITAINRELSAYAFKEFSKLEVLDAIVAERKEHSTIFNISGGQKLFDELRNNDIICSQRGSGIRVSFHFYNTAKNIAKVVDIIKIAKQHLLK